MIDVYIVGAGGYGRVAYGQMLEDPACGREWRIAGFLDERKQVLDGYGYDLGIVGDPFSHVPRANDGFVCALGAPAERRKYAAPLLARGARFINVMTELHRWPHVTFGQGCFIERRVGIGPDVKIGEFVMIHSLAILGHDIEVGAYSHISCFVFIGGGATIGADVTIHPHATILPGVKIGDGATVGAGSVVIGNVPPGITVFGNPARRLQW